MSTKDKGPNMCPGLFDVLLFCGGVSPGAVAPCRHPALRRPSCCLPCWPVRRRATGGPKSPIANTPAMICLIVAGRVSYSSRPSTVRSMPSSSWSNRAPPGLVDRRRTRRRSAAGSPDMFCWATGGREDFFLVFAICHLAELVGPHCVTSHARAVACSVSRRRQR